MSRLFTPAIANLPNSIASLSIQTGRFPVPDHCKTAQVLPLLKKTGLDMSSPANYRPISNLPTISKVLERLLLARLRLHLLGSSNFTELQSAYREGHSTETALLEIFLGVYTVTYDKLKSTFLVCLDLTPSITNHSSVCRPSSQWQEFR